MIEKNFIEIEGTFLVKIRNNAFNGTDGENVFRRINSFLKVVEPLKVRGLSHERFRLSVFPISLSGAASEWFRNECVGTISTWDDLVENFIKNSTIFKIEDGLFNFDTPLCIAFKEFNHLLKIDPDLFAYDIQVIKTYEEYKQELNNDKAQGLDEQWSNNGAQYRLCDHICEPYRFKNGITEWATCSSDIDGYFNGG
ncbi:hypothetical protein Tco_0252832 [Tanacetum coccineum]